MDSEINSKPESKNSFDITSAEVETWVFQKKVAMLYQNQTQSWILSLLASAIIAYLSIDSQQAAIGVSWWLLFLFITLLRTWNTKRFCKAYKSKVDIDYEAWFKRFFLYTLLAALGWCAGGILIGSDLEPLYQVYIFIVLLGVSAAAIPLLGVVQSVMLVFQVPTTIPYLIYVAIMLEDQGIILLFMFGLYLIGLMVAIRRMDKNLSESLALQYEKAQLADSLTESNQELQDANEKLETLTLEDALTGLNNRRYFEMKLESEWRRQSRNKKTIALMVIDIDYFKLYNDTYGHAEGDVCLQKVAQALKSSLHRSADIIARIGGEEFVVLLPDIDTTEGLKVARHMQKRLMSAAITHATSPLSEYVTVSIGLAAVVPDRNMTTLGLFKAADKALYKAKSRGRNQAVVGEIDYLEQ